MKSLSHIVVKEYHSNVVISYCMKVGLDYNQIKAFSVDTRLPRWRVGGQGHI